MKKITALLIIAISFSSCFNNYFKVKTNSGWNEDQLQLLQNSQKRIVVHFKNAYKEMVNPVFSAEQVSGKLESYKAMADKYMNPNTEEKKNFKYKYRYRETLFTEIHLYVNEDYAEQNQYTVNSSNFVKSNIYHPNKGLSIASHVLGVTMILVITTGVVAAVVAAGGGIGLSYTGISLAYNCPQAYIETAPGQYQFIGGLFTGALRRDLQRTDMIRLPDLPSSDTIRLQIRGLKDEIQFIDHASVKQIVHPEGTEIVGNQYGDLFLIRYLKMPNEVKAGNAVDRSKSLLFRDGLSYGFHIADSTENNSQLQLRFTRKECDKKAVLVTRMKNSTWSGYINHQLKSNQSNSLAVQAGYNSTMNAAMKISVLTRKGWKLADYFPPAGNTATRDLAMELDLSEVEGKEVYIRMEAPYRFWDIDQAGLCFETVKPSDITDIHKLSATKNGIDQSGTIDNEDHHYLSLESNDQLNLEYIKSPKTNNQGTTTTYMLVAGGYYRQRTEMILPQAIHPPVMSNSLNLYSIARYKELGLDH
ncbi:MAG TPA: hypothetical protein VK166_13065 [Chitinophagaceae bacterium]|nr:hypothetical protein [Chitinophagaceae bacterium]